MIPNPQWSYKVHRSTVSTELMKRKNGNAYQTVKLKCIHHVYGNCQTLSGDKVNDNELMNTLHLQRIVN